MSKSTEELQEVLDEYYGQRYCTVSEDSNDGKKRLEALLQKEYQEGGLKVLDILRNRIKLNSSDDGWIFDDIKSLEIELQSQLKQEGEEL